jgi:hypothetical protein
MRLKTLPRVVLGLNMIRDKTLLPHVLSRFAYGTGNLMKVKLNYIYLNVVSNIIYPGKKELYLH